jgi:hypothetical protein
MFFQTHFFTNGAQLIEPIYPAPGGAIRGSKPITPAAAFGEIIFNVGNHLICHCPAPLPFRKAN